MMLTSQCRELLRGPNFAVIATINADGTPQQSVVWRSAILMARKKPI